MGEHDPRAQAFRCSDAACVIDRFPQPFVTGRPEYAQLYRFAWEQALRNIRETNGVVHMDTAWDPARNYQWVWDLSFVGLFCRYASPSVPALAAFDQFYAFQREDGYIAMCYDFDTGTDVWPERINPPLFAWVEWEYYRTTGDASRLLRVVDPIERLMDWIDRNRRVAVGQYRKFVICMDPDIEDPPEAMLYWFNDGGASGMDDTPRMPRFPEAGRFFAWVDLSAQMALSFRSLSSIHKALGNAARAAEWNRRATELSALINQELWCERTRFFHDLSLPANFVGHKTVASFWTILAGVCDESRLSAMVDHLLDPREFNRPVPVPSLSADDCNYTEGGVYWRGGVWASTNYMITRGLMRSGQGQVAHDLAVRYLDVLWDTYQKIEPHTLWESYAPEKPEPGLAAYTLIRVKPHFVGWTGIGPIAMLIENVLGLDWDAPSGKMVWDVRLTAEHGIRQFRVAPGCCADLICHQRSAPDQPVRIEASSESAFDLEVRCGGRILHAAIPAGGRIVIEG
jgi:hypothetical protein